MLNSAQIIANCVLAIIFDISIILSLFLQVRSAFRWPIGRPRDWLSCLSSSSALPLPQQQKLRKRVVRRRTAASSTFPLRHFSTPGSSTRSSCWSSGYWYWSAHATGPFSRSFGHSNNGFVFHF